MGKLFSILSRRAPPSDPIKGPMPRIKNIAINNFRGLLGFFIGFAFLPAFEKNYAMKSVSNIWLLMAWYFFMQPVKIPVAGLLPVFMFPLTGVLSSDAACQAYFNDSIALLVIAGMLLLMLNNTHFDRRVALYFLCSGDPCQFSGKRLVFKASVGAFLMSIFSNRLIVTNTIVELTNPILLDMQAATEGRKDSEPNFKKMRYIVNNAIQTSAVIGSLVIVHASFGTLAFRAIWSENAGAGHEYEDIFNYFQYTVFALPVAILMFFVNVMYNMLLINWCTGQGVSYTRMNTMRDAFLQLKQKQKPMKIHEKYSIFFTLFFNLMLLFRWCKWFNYGWTAFRAEPSAPNIPGVKDVTVAAIFLLLLNIFPKDFKFMKYLTAKKESELPPCKPTSSILWWRFVDMNTNYSYILLIGSGVALNHAVKASGLNVKIATEVAPGITGLGWNGAIFVVVLMTTVLANLMTGVAACVVIMPFVLSFGAVPDANLPWPTKVYLGALGVGIASSFGYMQPFRYSPAYFTHFTGKTPRTHTALYAIGSVVICMLILWVALCIYAPAVFDPEGVGLTPVFVAQGAVQPTPPSVIPENPPAPAPVGD